MEEMQDGKKILCQLEQAGYQAYFVGGCVRDRLMGRPIHDIDICTDARPREVAALFEHVIPTGIKHGTVTVRFRGCSYEVTTFRLEKGYSDHRRPDEVRFVTDLHADLSRRDFTVNAMAMDARDALIDPFGGREDLRRSRIRAVGDPERRFQEDALRMLRACRFVSQLGFTLEAETKNALLKQISLLSEVARERIHDEWRKLMESPYPDRGWTLLIEARALADDPMLAALLQKKALPALPQLRSLKAAAARWVLLMICNGLDVQQCRPILQSARFAKQDIRTIERIYEAYLAYRRLDDGLDSAGAAEWLATYGWQAVESAIEIDAALRGLEKKTVKLKARSLYRKLPVKSLSDLQVDGRDLLRAIDAPPGPWIQKTLDELFSRVLEGKLPNEKEELLLAAKRWQKKKLR